MRHLVGLLILILLCGSLCAAQEEIGRDRHALNGPVRTVRFETATLSPNGNEMIEGPRVLLQVSSYDEKAGVAEQSVFNPDGSLKWKFRWVTSYDARGREAEREFFNANGVRTSKSVSRYDEKGRRIEITFFNPNGKINHIETFGYDGVGKMTEEVHRNPDGTIRNTQTYLYDKKGRRTEWTIYGSDGVISQRNSSTYDDKGREIGLIVDRGDGTVAMSETRSYDDQGNVREVLRHRNGVIVGRETFTYEFDARGNWIKRNVVRETIKDGTTRSELVVNYRTITYN